jgi:hypothetical protein
LEQAVEYCAASGQPIVLGGYNPFAEGTPFQADASVTAQLNIIHMLDKRRTRQYGLKL